MEKVLFDTDIGSDIDDAVALSYLLSQKKCNLLGITTVSGEPKKRAMIASAICRAARKDISIYPGTENPLFTKQRQPIAQQAVRLNNWEHENEFPSGEAIEFMRSTIRENPNEITLLAVGPLTNIALLFKIDPEIPKLLKRLVLMGGVFNDINKNKMTEWNIHCDPYAADVVYNADVLEHVSVGLDVTTKVVMNKKQVNDKFKAEILKPVKDFAGVWFEKVEKITFHDPLAATVIFNDQICSFEKGDVEVELKSDKLKGLTYFNKDKGNKKIASLVNDKLFFEHYFDIVK